MCGCPFNVEDNSWLFLNGDMFLKLVFGRWISSLKQQDAYDINDHSVADRRGTVNKYKCICAVDMNTHITDLPNKQRTLNPVQIGNALRKPTNPRVTGVTG